MIRFFCQQLLRGKLFPINPNNYYYKRKDSLAKNRQVYSVRRYAIKNPADIIQRGLYCIEIGF